MIKKLKKTLKLNHRLIKVNCKLISVFIIEHRYRIVKLLRLQNKFLKLENKSLNNKIKYISGKEQIFRINLLDTEGKIIDINSEYKK